MKNVFPLLAATIIMLTSCSKTSTSTNTNNNNNGNGNCPAISQTTLTSNSPVIVGWPLTLTTNTDMSYLYDWSGPNKFSINYTYYASDAGNQGKDTTTYADSGVYKVQLLTPDGCVAYVGTTDVQIIPAPPAPCNVPQNSSYSSLANIGGTYDDISFTGNTISAYSTAAGITLSFSFNSSGLPMPGIYGTSNTTTALSDTTVGCYFNDGFYDYVVENGLVYVNSLSGGKLQIGFCDCSVGNPTSYNVPPITASASITQP